VPAALMDPVNGPGELLELQEDHHLATLVQNWYFSPGRRFEASIFNSFRSSIHHLSSSPRGALHLLAAFRCYTFRLSESSVSLALHAALRGTPASLHVTFFKDRHFGFLVASKKVGFAVRELKPIMIDHFDIY
jgi:hypothetical protein